MCESICGDKKHYWDGSYSTSEWTKECLKEQHDAIEIKSICGEDKRVIRTKDNALLVKIDDILIPERSRLVIKLEKIDESK